MVEGSSIVAGSPEIDPSKLPERLEALPGIAELRAKVGATPVYLVGGAVRDLLLGANRADIDLVAEEDVAGLAASLGGEVTEHERFGTASVQLGDLDVDLARARAETYAHPGALPTVTPATLEDDLARRDFSINAMAVPLAGDVVLVDPHGGLDDLRAGRLRVLHEGSFADDPTRALRAARYHARLGFELEPETARQVESADLATVSGDRVLAELAKIAGEERPSEALQLIADWGLLDLGPGPRLAAAIERLYTEHPEWGEFADRDTAILLGVAAGEHPARLRHRAAKIAKHAVPGSPAEIQVLARDHVPEVLAMARAAGADWLDEYVNRLRHVELEISGDDLIDAGIPEGPAVGTGLNAALAARLDGEISGREEELRVALDAADDPSAARD
jgi:tRNA nucleotidyltransferase (CCA-adding enzyme)